MKQYSGCLNLLLFHLSLYDWTKMAYSVLTMPKLIKNNLLHEYKTITTMIKITTLWFNATNIKMICLINGDRFNIKGGTFWNGSNFGVSYLERKLITPHSCSICPCHFHGPAAWNWPVLTFSILWTYTKGLSISSPFHWAKPLICPKL